MPVASATRTTIALATLCCTCFSRMYRVRAVKIKKAPSNRWTTPAILASRLGEVTVLVVVCPCAMIKSLAGLARRIRRQDERWLS